mgnify:CR=1 FL=1
MKKKNDDSDNIYSYLKLKEKAEHGHQGASKLAGKLESKYSRLKYLRQAENLYFQQLKHEAIELKKKRAIAEYRKNMKLFGLKPNAKFEEVLKRRITSRVIKNAKKYGF